MTLGNHETLAHIIIILSRREHPLCPSAPHPLQRLHSRPDILLHGGVRFSFSYHLPRPILERNHVTISRLSSSSSIESGRCGGPAVSAGNKERGEEGGKSIRNSAEAFPLVSTRFMVVTSIVTEDIRFCYRFLRCLCNCEHHPPIVVPFFPPLETVQSVSILCMDGAGCDFCFLSVLALSARISLARSLPFSQ